MSHPDSLTWFQFHASDLSPWRWLVFRFHTWRCASCRARLRAEVTERHSFGPKTAVPRWWLVVAPVTVAVGLGAVVLGPSVLNMEDLRSKGGSRFDVVVVGPPVRALSSQCVEGDQLQASVESKRGYLLVVSVDSSGQVRTLFPLDGRQSASVRQEMHTLPNSWTLDSAAGRERFVAFFSDAPIASVDAQRAAVDERPALKGAETIVRDCSKVTR